MDFIGGPYGLELQVRELTRRVAALEARSVVSLAPDTALPTAPENPASSPVVSDTRTFADAVAWLHSRANGHRAKAAEAAAISRWGEMSRHAHAAEAIEAAAELLLAGAAP